MKKLVLILSIVALGLGAIGADLVIDSKTQTYSEHDSKIKFEGNVNVQIEDVKVVGEQADVTVSPNMKPLLHVSYCLLLHKHKACHRKLQYQASY